MTHCLRDLAWGCGFTALLAPSVTYSLSLLELAVRSRLGQPLDAVVPVRSAAGESLDSSCFSAAESGDGVLPGIDRVYLHLDRATGTLELRSAEPVREPLSELTIRVRCAGAPSLDRSFLVVLDPPDMRAESAFAQAAAAAPTVSDAAEAAPFEPAAAVAASPAKASAPVPTPASRRAPRSTRSAPGAAILPGSEYVVQSGDTLSSIALRVSGRPPNSLWTYVDRLHAANPRAFVGGDRDRLISGATLDIPASDGQAVAAQADAKPAIEAQPQPTPSGNPSGGVPTFAMTPRLSQNSREKLHLRDVGYMQAANAAAARLASRGLDTNLTHEEAPEAASVDSTIEKAQEASVAPVVAAPVEASPQEDVARAPEPATLSEPVRASEEDRGSRWTSMLAILALAGLGAAVAAWYRRRRHAAAELNRTQNQRRSSGRERVIRVDHGIIVNEHPAGMPFTVDASPSEIAALRMHAELQAATEAKVGPIAPDVGLAGFATEAPADVALRMASPIAALDLEFPEMDEFPETIELLAAAADETFPMDAADVTLTAKPDLGNDADATRQFMADARLVDVPRHAKIAEPSHDETTELLPMDILRELPGLPPITEADSGDAFQTQRLSNLDEATLPSEPVENVSADDPFQTAEVCTIDDVGITGEHTIEANVVALWDSKQDKPEKQAEPQPLDRDAHDQIEPRRPAKRRARGSKKG
jgi:hypothetical protein